MTRFERTGVKRVFATALRVGVATTFRTGVELLKTGVCTITCDRRLFARAKRRFDVETAITGATVLVTTLVLWAPCAKAAGVARPTSAAAARKAFIIFILLFSFWDTSLTRRFTKPGAPTANKT